MNIENIKIALIDKPTPEDLMGVKRRALVTVGKAPVTPPSTKWLHDIADAEHSPIRYLMFSFSIQGIPYWLSTELSRHVHAQPYIKSQRNDRQSNYDRNEARQDAPVDMIWDINGEEIMAIAHKRLCGKATKEARMIVGEMCRQILFDYPFYEGLLVPNCVYRGGVCHEIGGSCIKEDNG